MICAQNLHFQYHLHGPWVINNLSFSYAHPSFVLLRGPSGTGKTTLIHLLAGLMVPSSGKLLVLGRSLAQDHDYRRSLWRAQHVGVIFQKLNLHSELSIRENVKLLFDLFPYFLPPWDEPLFQQYLHEFHLHVGEQRKAGELSLGQQQRVAVIRVLMQKPKLILADEPTSSLDSENARLVINALFNYAQQNQSSLFLSSHEPWIQGLFDQVIDFKEPK